ncbi:MAG: UDP-N-acetylmuramate--L-alanine ligase [Candidatus Pelagibacter sp. TMED166]|nr:MAG: UDP-N-acetylmuramate--L-alanine ligase [Candidatus Pelagibacter sp. TMED166]
MKIEIGKTEVIHFVGIGGIGMSGLALIMKNKGFNVQGSDISLNKNIERLKKENLKIVIGHNKKNVNSATILVISSAIKSNNPEVIEAKNKNLPIYKRGEMLAHIVSLTQNIVVAGSHGKTTTTSLIAAIFSNSNLDPTIINGGVLNSIKKSAQLGKSNWCILESDESDGSFVKVPSTYSIITNIDKEHMDYYKSMKNLKREFSFFINNVPSFGKSFICIDDKNNREILNEIKNKNFYTYGLDKKANFQISKVSFNQNFSKFNINIRLPGKKNFIFKNLKVPLLGMHNIKNTAAAVAVCLNIGIPKSKIKKGLKNFQGVQRRFNWIFNFRKASFFDDYAHHPTEIREVLDGVKNVYKKEEIICVFQPHRISRLNTLRKEFSNSFKKANTVILCPVYRAGEKIKLKFNYLKFAKEVQSNSNVKVFLIKNNVELAKFIKQYIYEKKIVIGMGAGSISNWIRELPKIL